MKNVVIFGASGRTGKYITKKMLSLSDLKVTAFVRTPSKLNGIDTSNLQVIQGDALNAEDVKRAMKNQEILLCSLSGDVLTMAKNIVASLSQTSVKRIIWITGFGIHSEITGPRGEMLKKYLVSMPEYPVAADTIAQCNAVTTLLRCPLIVDGDNEVYHLTKEGEQPKDANVERAAIAKCMADMIFDEKLGANESLAITN